MTSGRKGSDQYLHFPSRAGAAATEEFTRRQAEQVRFDWGVPILDQYLTPMMRGDLVTLVGRPGHGKTSLMIAAIKRASELLRQERNDVKRYAVYVTWETLVEEFVAIRLSGASGQTLESIGRGTADLLALEKAIAMSVADRIVVVGRSMATTGPMPNLLDVEACLRTMVENGTPPAILGFDYLQRIPGRPGQDRTQTVPENLEMIKDLALSFSVPALVAVQAKRDVDEYKGLQVPSLSDGQWTSNIEQTSDKVIGTTLPAKYLEKGRVIEVGSEKYEVNSRLMAIKVNKQRWSDAGDVLMLDFDPRTLNFGPAACKADEEEIF